MEGPMPKGYIVVSYRDAPNDETLNDYAPKALESKTNAGAKFIARDMTIAAFENGIQQRTVIVEFESSAAARAAITSNACQAAFALLGNVECDIRVIEGFE